MTIQHHLHDAHHDLTWLAGALARALFARADAHEVVLAALERMAECDFSTPPVRLRPALADACRWLPETLTVAFGHAEEMALALAAAMEHLHWRPLRKDGDGAVARVVGTEGPLVCARARVDILVAGPGTVVPWTERSLLYVLAGRVRVAEEHGIFRHLSAGDVALVATGENNGDRGGLSVAEQKPLLAALLARGDDGHEEAPFARLLRG